MKNRNIKLFEDFSVELLVNRVYEEMMQNFLYESDFSNMGDEDDSYQRELTSGEKGALARDLQIITPEQLAAIYLRALGKSEGDTGKYLVMIPGMEQFGEKDKDSRAFKISLPAFSDAIGLESQATGMIVTGKFINLLNGSEEYRLHPIAPKIIKAFYKFNEKSPSEIAGLASKAIQDTSFTQNRAKAMDALDKAAEYRKARKQSDINTGMKVYALINSLRTASPIFSDIKKAQKSAIAKIASEINEDPEKIKTAYMEYLRSKGLLNDKMYFREK